MERDVQVSQLGVDVAVETAGAIPALQQAIRATRFGGTICVVSFYSKDSAGLYLGDEFHVNQLQLISVRAESLPMRDAPAWTLRAGGRCQPRLACAGALTDRRYR